MKDLKEVVDTYIPIKQVAKELNVNKMFIIQEIKEGNLEAYFVAGGYRVRRSTLDTYLEARKVQPVISE